MSGDSESRATTEKTDRETLIRDVASTFNNYLGQGIRVDSFVEKAVPTLSIDGLERVLQVHFLISNGRTPAESDEQNMPSVAEFVDELPDRLRRLKSVSTQRTETSRGAVEGAIDWSKTVAERSRTPGHVTTTYAYQKKTRRIDTPENRVLKHLLQTIHHVVENVVTELVDDVEAYEWSKPWLGNTERRKKLRQALFDNPHLSNLCVPENGPDHRTVEQVTHTRSALYREAALLLRRYQRLMNYDLYPDEAREVLRKFFVSPGPESSSIDSDGTEVLFEFYWIAKLLENLPEVNFELVTDAHEAGLVAYWKDTENIYEVYHDSERTNVLSFADNNTDLLDEGRITMDATDWMTQRRRYVRAIDGLHSDLRTGNVGERFCGRPDIVAQKRDRESGELVSAFVGEVKYTRYDKTTREGLEELAEYLSHVKVGDRHLVTDGNIWDASMVSGGLFVDRLPFSKEQFPEGLQVYQFGDSPTLPFCD